MTEQDESTSTQTKKWQKEKEEDKITEYTNDKGEYRVGDTVYIESQRPDLPYYICSIKDFKKSKKDNITVDVIWFFRPCEIPTSVYQLLLQDRNTENGGSTENVLDNPVVKERELFISDAVDIFPATSIRGPANCAPFNDIKENVMEYISNEDNWYYILRYNPESRRMANAKGEIRIGASHQAKLPTCITYRQRSREDLKKLNEICLEELVWDPYAIQKSKLMVYLRAAQSITSFSGYCDNTENAPCVIDKGLNTISEDLPLAYTHDVLHHNNYDISTALQDLITHPAPKITMLPFTEDERKKFMRGLRSYGKTFHKIRKELLPDRSTSELVQYYYFWKKTSIACSSRPHKRGGRRHNVLARKTRTTKPKTTEVSEFLDLSSCSENECVDSEDSENTRDLSLYACRHCYTTKSPNWHHGGKRKVLLCYNCRIHFKRYGEMKTLKEEEKREPPPYIYKAAFENLEEQQPYTGRMRTRRSSTPVFGGAAAVRNRILQDQGKSNRRQITPVQITHDNSEESDTKANPPKRKTARGGEMNDGSKGEAKKARLERTESEEADDADDESEADSETGSRSDSNNQASSESSRSQSPATTTSIISSNGKQVDTISLKQQQQQQQLQQITADEAADQCTTVTTCVEPPKNEFNTFVPIKEESPEVPTNNRVQEIENPSSPSDVPDDREKLEKISERFIHNVTDPNNSCSRCERIYVFVRPKKQKIPQESEKRIDDHPHNRMEKEALHYKRRETASPPIHQPAQITSHYETMRLIQQQEHQRFMPNYIPHDHGHRAGSPRDMRDPREQREFFEPAAGKYHYMRLDCGPPEHRSPQSSVISHQISHHAHPFTPRTNEVPGRDFRLRQNPRGNLPPVPSSIESALSRAHHAGINSIPGERVPPIDRPLIEPSSPVQPHLHSHLHTHTHLHVHPDEIKYRNSVAANEAAHFERHDRVNQQHPATVPTSVASHQHRPSSRSRELYEHPMKGYPAELIAQSHDLHLRESVNRHLPRDVRESHGPPTVSREGAASPSFPQESQDIHRDAVAYYHWARMQHNRMNPAASRHVPGQAPDLSPRGLPPGMRHTPAEFREKHIAQSPQIQEREKIALELEKQMRAQNLLREHTELKMKNERSISERNFRPEDLHQYHGSNFMDVRRIEEARTHFYDRQIHDPSVLMRTERLAQFEHERAMHERYIRAVQQERPHHDRLPHDRLPHERLPHERLLERSPHDRTPHEQQRQLHERAMHERLPHERLTLERPGAIYDHYKPETIDLSGE